VSGRPLRRPGHGTVSPWLARATAGHGHPGVVAGRATCLDHERRGPRVLLDTAAGPVVPGSARSLDRDASPFCFFFRRPTIALCPMPWSMASTWVMACPARRPAKVGRGVRMDSVGHRQSVPAPSGQQHAEIDRADDDHDETYSQAFLKLASRNRASSKTSHIHRDDQDLVSPVANPNLPLSAAACA